MGANRAMALALAVLAGAGSAIAVYLTTVHYGDVPLACSSAGVVNCEQVLTSSYSEVAGIPWSIGGIAWFGVSLVLGVVVMRAPEPGWLQPAQVAWSAIGLLAVVYLVGVELTAVHKICIWCTAMHVLIVATFVLAVLRTPALEEEPVI